MEGRVAATDVREPSRRRDFVRVRVRLYAVLFAADALLMAVSFLVANQLRFGVLTASYGLNTFLLLFPLYAVLGFHRGAWSIDALSNPRRSAALAVKSLLFGIALSSV